MAERPGFFDCKLLLTREAIGAVVALLSTALLIVLCYGGMRISGIWAGL